MGSGSNDSGKSGRRANCKPTHNGDNALGGLDNNSLRAPPIAKQTLSCARSARAARAASRWRRAATTPWPPSLHARNLPAPRLKAPAHSVGLFTLLSPISLLPLLLCSQQQGELFADQPTMALRASTKATAVRANGRTVVRVSFRLEGKPAKQSTSGQQAPVLRNRVVGERCALTPKVTCCVCSL